ncbi:hypothetical protein ACP6H1_27250 [Vibrio harveyi]|uniref:hypothetical protein n=1 Tax=Vibrio harveyi TaxID=669 RepID=UPI003CF27836
MLFRILPLMALILVGLSSPPAMASSDECGIWLCMPFGFPSGCGDAKKAFKDRIKHFKSPLPPLHKCWFKSDNLPGVPATENVPSMGSKEGIAALIPTHSQCTKWHETNVGNKHHETTCIEYKTIQAHAVKDTSCKFGGGGEKNTPQYCTRTIRYVDFLMDGQPYQDTYYYDSSGNEITISK